jgi:hypothetical protein
MRTSVVLAVAGAALGDIARVPPKGWNRSKLSALSR